MTRQDIIDYCLTFSAAYEDYPFAEIGGDDTAVMRHRANKKFFALIMHHDGKLYLNLKCDPLEADFLRQAFEGVIPGWHMNKEHWNSVVIGTDVPDDEIKRQIGNSYGLIKPKIKTGNGRLYTAYIEK
jgi:predicted DNA-binding protein (MmcQ/YjbR family)